MIVGFLSNTLYRTGSINLGYNFNTLHAIPCHRIYRQLNLHTLNGAANIPENDVTKIGNGIHNDVHVYHLPLLLMI